jgi:hypothetical protein
MTLCALGVTILCLPATTVAQETCVRTSAGSVVCGTPVRKPSSTPNRTDSDTTIQTQVWRNITLELKSCAREARNVVSCTLSLSNSQNSGFGINVCPDTKLVDSSGNEYHSDKVQVVNKIGSGCNNLFFDMAQGAHYKTTIEFTDVPAEISKVVLLQINSPYGVVAQFRNVPIN